jgi:hypothetical protein
MLSTKYNPVLPPYHYSMSKIGTCARTISANMLDIIKSDGSGTTPEYLRLAAREGRRHEKFIREDIKEFGWNSVALTSEDVACSKCNRDGYHVEIQQPTRTLVGHIDDFVFNDNDTTNMHIAEYKALGRFTTDKIIKKGIDFYRTYATQITLYHEACNNLPMLYVIKSRDTGSHHLTIMEKPPLGMDEITTRLDTIESYISQGELAPCDMPDDFIDKWSCTGLCEAGPTIVEADLPENVTKAVHDLRVSKILENEAESIKANSRKFLHAYLDGAGLSRIMVDDMQVTFVAEKETPHYQIPQEIKDNYKTYKKRPSHIRVTDKREA